MLDFYKEAFGRDSYDNKGGRVVAWRFWQRDLKAVQTVDDDGKVAPSGFYKLDW